MAPVLADLFPLSGLVVLLFTFLSPVPWKLNPSPAMELRPYVAPQGYLPDIPCSSDTNLLAGLAALLNGTNSTTLLDGNTTAAFQMTPQQLFKGGGGEDDGGSGILGDLIDGISSVVQASAGSGSGSSITIAPHGDFASNPNATQRVWLGPLGSCTQDLDGRRWCTKPSYHRPNYNISSFIQPNAYLYPAVIQSQTLARTTLAFIILAAISCLLSFFGNIGKEWNYPVLFYNVVIMISEFVTLWVWFSMGSIEQSPGSTNPTQLNNVNNFFMCNQTSGLVQLTPGDQFYVLMGNHYALLWASWVLIYVLGTAFSVVRVAIFD